MSCQMQSANESLALEVLATGAFPCIVNVWPPSAVLGADICTTKGTSNSQGSGSSFPTPDSKGCTRSSTSFLTTAGGDDDESPRQLASVDSEPSATALSPDASNEGELCGSCHVSLATPSATRKPPGGLSAALRGQPLALNDTLREPSAGCQGSVGVQSIHAASAAGRVPQRAAMLSAAAPSHFAAALGRFRGAAAAAATSTGPAAKPGSASGAADPDDSADGGSSARASVSDAPWDSLPCFSPSLVDRLWTGRASAGSNGSSGSQPLRSNRLVPLFGLPLREGSSARKRSQQGQGRQSAAQQQQRRRQEKDNSGPLAFLTEADDLAELGGATARPTAASGATAGRGVSDLSPAPHVPCMAVVAAAAAAAPAPRALGAACSASRCSCNAASALAGRPAAAAKAAGSVRSACRAAATASFPQAPGPPPLPPAVAAVAALGQCLDNEIGMPSLGLPKADGGGGSGSSATPDPGGAEAPASLAATAHPSDAATLAAAARQAYSEPRGHVHNGPRMPMYGSPVVPGHEGSQPTSDAASPVAVVDVDVDVGSQPSLPASGMRVAVGRAAHAGGDVEGWIEGARQADSPMSQTSTIWDNPQAAGSYSARNLHSRTRSWFGRRQGAGRGPGSPAAAGGGSGGAGGGCSADEDGASSSGGPAGALPDARTRWWDISGRFNEDDNAVMRQERFPYERAAEQRRGGRSWLRWWR